MFENLILLTFQIMRNVFQNVCTLVEIELHVCFSVLRKRGS